MQMLYSPLRVLAPEDADVVYGPAALCEGALPRWCTPLRLRARACSPASSTAVLLRSACGSPPRLFAAAPVSCALGTA
jgi:hypothetical protein